MKIDIVYTWVNGSDPKWKNKRIEKAKLIGKVLEDSTNEALFMDNQELKYSLRSLDQFVPWINNIFIVTDNQIPDWINLENPKVRIVDHTEIFLDKSNLSTFSSQVIESQIHHIKDLSEFFIYFNDDMFIGNYCTPEYFYTKEGLPRIYVSEIIPIPNKKSLDITKRAPNKRNTYQHTVVNTRKLIMERFGKAVYYNIRHTIKPLLKSILFDLERIFEKELNQTIKNSFRTNDDILLIYLFEFYLIAQKLGKTQYLITSDVNISALDLFSHLYKKFTFGFINLHEKDIEEHLERLKKAKPFTFCLNQTPETPDEHLVKVKQFLEEYFPKKSQFEK
ncbi:MAG: stealth family protein [Bacteroidetes bacterium]|nr:stealth family protein [Bacteroidota bacterium]MBU2505731.1 stealth family protein [Bacteroidota bacterium]